MYMRHYWSNILWRRDGGGFVCLCMTTCSNVLKLPALFIGGHSFDVILFDVDSKDTTLGMSCPPSAFVETSLLKKVYSLLTPRGKYFLLKEVLKSWDRAGWYNCKGCYHGIKCLSFEILLYRLYWYVNIRVAQYYLKLYTHKSDKHAWMRK